MSENKFDIEKFWDDFLAEDDDKDVGLKDAVNNDDKIDLFSAESKNDLSSEQLVDKQNEINNSVNEKIDKNQIENNTTLDSDIKPIGIESLNGFLDIKPVLAEDSIDRIKRDESILDTTKDERLEKEYMQNLSKEEKA